MGRVFIVNASPLILLARIKRLDLLGALADGIVVPVQVMNERAAGAEGTPLAAQEPVEDGSFGSGIEASRSQPSFWRVIDSIRTSLPSAFRSGRISYSETQQRKTW